MEVPNEDHGRPASRYVLYDLLIEHGIQLWRPTGGHGFILTQGPVASYSEAPVSAQFLTAGAYVEGGIRGAELGGCAFGHNDPETGEGGLNLSRKACYTKAGVHRQAHGCGGQALRVVRERASRLKVFRLTYEAPRSDTLQPGLKEPSSCTETATETAPVRGKSGVKTEGFYVKRKDSHRLGGTA